MRYFYRSPDGMVYEFDSQEDAETYGPSGIIRMSESEVNDHLASQGSPRTYKKDLAELNSAYQEDVLKLNQAYSLASLSNGPGESVKISTIRSQYESRKALHSSNIAALKSEYGV